MLILSSVPNSTGSVAVFGSIAATGTDVGNGPDIGTQGKSSVEREVIKEAQAVGVLGLEIPGKTEVHAGTGSFADEIDNGVSASVGEDVDTPVETEREEELVDSDVHVPGDDVEVEVDKVWIDAESTIVDIGKDERCAELDRGVEMGKLELNLDSDVDVGVIKEVATDVVNEVDTVDMVEDDNEEVVNNGDVTDDVVVVAGHKEEINGAEVGTGEGTLNGLDVQVVVLREECLLNDDGCDVAGNDVGDSVVSA